MTISDIYDLSLYLAEKTDDNTGYIDSEYKIQHQKKAEVIIRQAIRKFADLQNEAMPDIDLFSTDDEIPLSDYALKNIIPYYVGAMLCAHDKDTDKYNILIYEYQNEIEHLRYDEDQINIYDVISGLE